LRKPSGGAPEGFGKGCILGFVILLLIVFLLGWRVGSQAAPTIRLQAPLKGIGQSTPVVFAVADPRHNIKRVQVELRQGERAYSVIDSALPTPSWWRFWSRAGQREFVFTVRVGRKEFPELQEGRAALHFTATNDSWGRFFRGGQNELRLELPVRFVPPQLQVLSSPHYVNQGGAEMVVFKVSPGTTESGVQVGTYFFPSWPVKDSLPETRLCLFAFPYNVDPKTPARLVARDDAGNETVSDFTYRVFPKSFHTDTIQVTDDFVARVVPPILSQTPGVEDQGSLLKNFLFVNGSLRERNARELQAFAEKTSPRFLWSRPFVQLGNSKVEAGFADHRTYLYNDQVIDHQDHLGFDLAVVEHNPVVAANDGVVIHAGYFGIYGNTIVIDHGCGLQSLYGHLSSLDVKAGDAVKRGQVIARSGQTGLAGGDHLHFTTLLNGIPVNPVEWWDPHWIHDRIDAKLAAYR
jgi:murein DD-endopeptidase MepM/ murein hydrolase activator NlpD